MRHLAVALGCVAVATSASACLNAFIVRLIPKLCSFTRNNKYKKNLNETLAPKSRKVVKRDMNNGGELWKRRSGRDCKT